MLSKQVFIVNRPKTENETVYYNVDYIHTAIYENKEIKFHYAEWTVKKELKLKKCGAFYVVSPWALTWDDENYYLVAYDAAAGIIKHYRVDKMQNTEILETDRKGENSFRNFDLAAFAKKTFGMYGGVDAEVTLECRNELAGVIIDRFGHDVWLIPQGEDHFKARVLVSVSPQFFGWVTGIGSGMKITGPENVKQQYKEYLLNVLQNYQEVGSSEFKKRMDIGNDDARVINEILTILNDRDVYAQRQMEKNRRIDLDDLFEKQSLSNVKRNHVIMAQRWSCCYNRKERARYRQYVGTSCDFAEQEIKNECINVV